jgi:hypothetical protein
VAAKLVAAFKLEHVTIQTEHEPCPDAERSHA